MTEIYENPPDIGEKNRRNEPFILGNFVNVQASETINFQRWKASWTTNSGFVTFLLFVLITAIIAVFWASKRHRKGKDM